MPHCEPQVRADHERLVQDHYASVYRFLRNLTRRAVDAEDLAQQTFLRAIGAWSRYDDRLPIRSWLYAIAFREFCKWRRNRLWLPLPTDRPAVGDAYEQFADAESLLNALGGLSQNIRATFLLHYVEELSIVDIAVLLDIPEGTVKSRLHQARHRLKNLLQEDESYVPETV